MAATFIIPDFSDLRCVRDQLLTVPDFSVLSARDSMARLTKLVYLDLTFDLFQKQVSPAFLYSAFRDNEEHLNRIGREDVRLIVLRGYPFRATPPELLIKQKILDQYAALLSEFHGAALVYVPTVISRNTLSASQNPPGRLIQAIRSASADTGIAYRKSSRFFLIYDRDLLSFLAHHDGGMSGAGKTALCLEGVETTLEEISSGAERVTGRPVDGGRDGTAVVQYELPEGLVQMVPAVRYALEDMLVDITSYLF